MPDYIIKDAEPHPPENLTVAGVLAQSSNLGALLISRRLPSTSALESELRSFGLGSLTGVGLPGESPGLLAPSSKWSVDQAATIPYGQGMSVNALQVADAYAAIANGGVRVTPKVIAATINGKGKLEPTPAGPTRPRGEPADREDHAGAARAGDHLDARHRRSGLGARLPGGRQDGNGGPDRPCHRQVRRLRRVVRGLRSG